MYLVNCGRTSVKHFLCRLMTFQSVFIILKNEDNLIGIIDSFQEKSVRLINKLHKNLMLLVFSGKWHCCCLKLFMKQFVYDNVTNFNLSSTFFIYSNSMRKFQYRLEIYLIPASQYYSQRAPSDKNRLI